MSFLTATGWFLGGFALAFVLIFVPEIIRYLRGNVWDYPLWYYRTRRWYRLNRLSIWHRLFLVVFFLLFWAGSWLLSFAIRP